MSQIHALLNRAIDDLQKGNPRDALLTIEGLLVLAGTQPLKHPRYIHQWHGDAAYALMDEILKPPAS